MDNVIIVAVLAAVLGIALAYVIKAKKKGVKCIGCPHSKECSEKSRSLRAECSGNCGGCSCSCQTDND